MRGIEREERSQVTDLLRQGIPPSTIVKELGELGALDGLGEKEQMSLFEFSFE